MKIKLKSVLLMATALVLMLNACQEPDVLENTDPSGTAASKPILTVGFGNRVIINTPTIWSNDFTYLLNGEVIVRNTVLIIEPGTIILGKKDPNPNDTNLLNSVLVIDTNAQLFAQGTSTQPIVFTSDQPAGSRNRGDWGGVIVLGQDVVNQGTAGIDGLRNRLTFGGTGDTRTEGSGILQYVRIEFAGTILSDSDETNGLTLGGVGANTTIDHIQVSRSNDDGFQFFGGSVDARFLISWQSRDDDFDTSLGHTGVIQYAVSRRENAFVSRESNGIESENDGFGTSLAPKTNTLFANITFIGPANLNGDGSEIDLSISGGFFNAGALIRRNSATNVLNSIMTGWPTGTEIRNNNTAVSFYFDNTLRLQGLTVGLPSPGSAAFAPTNMSAGNINQCNTEYNTTAFDNITVIRDTSDPLRANNAILVGLKDAAFNATAPDFTQLSSSANLGNSVTLSSSATSRGLVQENFRGAFDTDGAVAGGNWDFNSGWLEFDPENANYH